MASHTFICYAHQDTRFATQLAENLREQGVWVWFDQWRVTDHSAWDQMTSQALLTCAQFVLILSPAAADSLAVREQTLLAIAHDKPIVPVLHRPCPLPELLHAVQPVDFSRGRRQAALAQLVDRLTGRSPAPERPPLVGPWLRRLAGLVVVVLLLAGLGLYFVRARPAAERVVVPQHVQPVTAATSIIVPTIDAVPVFNTEPTPIDEKLRAADGQPMVFVPAGDFLLGSRQDDPEADEDEKPQRVIYLDGFWIDKTEISNARYQKCVAAGVCAESAVLWSRYRQPDLPVVSVSWEQASAYCHWAGGRLPSEAEWEKAARGADGRSYPWGDHFDGTRLNYCDKNCIADWRDPTADDGYSYTAPVGSYLAGASPFGALDMSGNVWEWTADWYAPDAYQSAPYKNPGGPENGRQRVIRGGSWLYNGRSLRTTERHKEAPHYRYENIGFRCVVGE